MKFSATLKQVKEKLQTVGLTSEVIGDENTVLEGFASIADAGPSDVVMLRANTKSEKTQELI
jgi:hypothetical protein